MLGTSVLMYTVVTLSRIGVTKRYYSGTRIALEPPEDTAVTLR